MQTTVYRLLQEALTNITKHARANTVRVTLKQSDGELSIEVQDDGQGFDTSAQSSGFGLLGMNERVGLGRRDAQHQLGLRRHAPGRASAAARRRSCGVSGAQQAAS